MNTGNKVLIVPNDGFSARHEAIIDDGLRAVIEEYLAANLTVDTIDNLTETFKMIAKYLECELNVAGFVALQLLGENILKLSSE